MRAILGPDLGSVKFYSQPWKIGGPQRPPSPGVGAQFHLWSPRPLLLCKNPLWLSSPSSFRSFSLFPGFDPRASSFDSVPRISTSVFPQRERAMGSRSNYHLIGGLTVGNQPYL